MASKIDKVVDTNKIHKKGKKMMKRHMKGKKFNQAQFDKTKKSVFGMK